MNFISEMSILTSQELKEMVRRSISDDNEFIASHLNLGLCCINNELRKAKPPVFCSRTCIRKNFTIESAKKKAMENVKDISKLIEWNHKNGIKCLRISSDIFPHFTDTETEKYTIDFAESELKKAGVLAKKYGHRILMHPGQYNQVGTPNENVFKKTIEDLEHHANILDKMGIGEDGVIIVHGGGVFGNKKKTIDRWVKQFHSLPESVRKRLVIENCERCYSISDCITISKRCNIPIVFDFHHYSCWNTIYPDKGEPKFEDVIEDIIKSWESTDDKGKKYTRRIVMHVSDQAEGKRIGSHHDYVENIPEELFKAILKYGIHVDLEIEAKAKEKAVLKLYSKYNYIFGRK